MQRCFSAIAPSTTAQCRVATCGAASGLGHVVPDGEGALPAAALRRRPHRSRVRMHARRQLQPTGITDQSGMQLHLPRSMHGQ